MKQKFLNLAAFVYDNFSPLIVFVTVKNFTDLKTAIIASVVFAVADIIGRHIRKTPISRLYYFSFVVSVIFGAIDIYATHPFIFKYESVVTNLITAAFFGITLFRGTPLIQELAEKAMPPEKFARPEIKHYLRVLTAIWTLYFIVKAVVYAYVGYTYEIDAAIAFRAVFGIASFVVLFFGERLFRKLLFRLIAKPK